MFIAKTDTMLDGYEIADVDAEGLGVKVATIYTPGINKNKVLCEKMTRILLLALNMDGGVDRALEMMRAETVRQRA